MLCTSARWRLGHSSDTWRRPLISSTRLETIHPLAKLQLISLEINPTGLGREINTNKQLSCRLNEKPNRSTLDRLPESVSLLMLIESSPAVGYFINSVVRHGVPHLSPRVWALTPHSTDQRKKSNQKLNETGKQKTQLTVGWTISVVFPKTKTQ